MDGRKMRLAALILFAIGCLVAVSGCGGEGALRPPIVLEATPSQGIQSYPEGIALWVLQVTVPPEELRPVSLSASSVAGVACEVVPATLNGSGTVEVLARPDATVAGRTVNVVVRAQPERAADAALANDTTRLALDLEVLRYNDTLADEARRRARPFVTYLAANHPEFGIDNQTAWEGWVSAPNILIVTWYSFLSSDWEALIQWHVMIPPHDWTHVFLRRRGSPACEWAGEMSTEGAPIEEVTPPDPFPRFEAPWIPLG